MSDRIPLAEPYLGGNEAAYLAECVETNFVSSVGPFVRRFEEAFAERVGSRYAIACSSGTAALHVALIAAGAKPGTDVVTSLLTFVASANVAAYLGSQVVLADSEATTWNLDTEMVRDHVVGLARDGGNLPSVLEPVHLLGHPADLEPLLDLRDRFEIPIVEDAAEALGATYASGPLAGKGVGTIGDLGCFSFNGNKVITAGAGGMVVTDDEDLATRVRHLTTQARLPGAAYAHDEIGFNYRLSNLSAALGLAQLEQLDSFLERKREIADGYDEGLADSGLELAPRTEWASPSWWLYTVLVPGGSAERDALAHYLASAGIDARPVWTPISDHGPYRSAPIIGSGMVARHIFDRGLTLPSSVGLSTGQQECVIGKLLEAETGAPAGSSTVRGRP